MNANNNKRLYLFDLDDTLCDTSGWKKSWSEETDYFRLRLQFMPDAKEVLSVLDGPKVLVTAGDKVTQTQKSLLLGVRLGLENIFSEIHIVEKNEDKEDAFRAIAKQYRENSHENDRIWGRHVVVIGNRIDSEIYYGNMLGFTTVRMLHGSYAAARPANLFQIPHHTIRNLGALLRLPCVKRKSGM